MRHVLSFVVLFSCVIVVLFSCQKYQDKPATTDPRLTNPYCNDPNAVNYNWGFPGTPNDSVCFYPTDVFKGTLVFNDSILQSDNTFAYAKVETLSAYPITNTKMAVLGFCSGGDSLKMTASRASIATIDTNVITGQQFCRVQDTISGTITKDYFDSTLFHVNFTVVADTGTTFHTGSAIKL